MRVPIGEYLSVFIVHRENDPDLKYPGDTGKFKIIQGDYADSVVTRIISHNGRDRDFFKGIKVGDKLWIKVGKTKYSQYPVVVAYKVVVEEWIKASEFDELEMS